MLRQPLFCFFTQNEPVLRTQNRPAKKYPCSILIKREMIQRFSSLSVHEKQACFPGCPFFVFFLKSIIAETFPHLYTNGALSFYFLFPIIGQLTDKCNPFFYKLRSSSASACACSRYQPSSSSSASTNSIYSFSVASFTSRLNCSREIFVFNASYIRS